MKEELKFIKPQKEHLSKWIKLYYFHTSSDVNFNKEITYFPNYTTTLNAYKNTQITWSDFERTHTYKKTNDITCLLVGKINLLRKIKMVGPLNKITIVFNPLGLNNFIPIPLSTLIQEHFSFFDYFGGPFNEMLAKIFDIDNLEDRANILDAYFEKQIRPFQEDRLMTTINNILHSEESLRIGQLAKNIGVHRRTLLRLFQKHLAYTPEEFLSVVKFRKAMIHYQTNKSSLTKVALDNNYYDQSDFIKQFKLKCGDSPKQIFSQINTLEKGLFWKFA